MRSQAPPLSHNTVPKSYFCKYILLLIYTFIHKINNHKKKSDLTKKKKRKKEGDTPTLYNSFGISGFIICASCTRERRGGRDDGLWGDVARVGAGSV